MSCHGGCVRTRVSYVRRQVCRYLGDELGEQSCSGDSEAFSVTSGQGIQVWMTSADTEALAASTFPESLNRTQKI
jgi:hypothetical protein